MFGPLVLLWIVLRIACEFFGLWIKTDIVLFLAAGHEGPGMRALTTCKKIQQSLAIDKNKVMHPFATHATVNAP